MNRIIPLKVGWFGEQGTGKTTSAALLSAALSREVHSGAEVWVTDPELGWQFSESIIFRPEKIKLVQRNTPTFKALLRDLREAEKAGACVFAVELTKLWQELLETVHRNCGDRWGSELVKLWGEWVTAFLNSPIHCMALARVGDLTEDVYNERNEIKRVKIAEGMKAGGQKNNFGYEPHLVLRMIREQKPRVKKGRTFEEEGRVIHRADVLKDRTWKLNGKVIRWLDMNEYEPGGYEHVWESLRPHFAVTQSLAGIRTLDTNDSSDALVDDNGRGNFYHDQRERESLLQEWDATMDMIAPGQTGEARRIRALLGEIFTGARARNRFEDKPLQEIASAVLGLMDFEKRIREARPNSEEEWTTLARKSKTEGPSPGKKLTLIEMTLQRYVSQRDQAAAL